MEESRLKQYNVYMLGLCFCLVFTGFNTIGGIQTLIFESAKNPNSDGYVEGFHGNGLWSLAIIYMVFTAANWIAPSVVALLGPRATMIVGALIYGTFIAQLLVLNTVLLYVCSAILGVGAAIIWTAQGNFLSRNSDESSISRNSGIFWAIQISSNVFGNVFVFFQFNGQEDIDTKTRNTIGVVFLSVTVVGSLMMLLLRPVSSATDNASASVSPRAALQDSFRLFLTSDMMLLSLTFFYTGIQLNIYTLYGTCIGFTSAFGEQRKALATISGIFVAVGEVVGGATFGIFGNMTVKRGRDPVVMLGFVISMVAYFLIFLNLPKESTLAETLPSQTAYIDSNKYLAIFSSFLLGLSDSCFNTQIFSLLGGTYSHKSASAFAIFKFMQSLATSIAFWYSPVLNLYWQLLVAVVFDVVGTLAFCVVEWRRGRGPGSSGDTSCGVSDDPKVE